MYTWVEPSQYCFPIGIVYSCNSQYYLEKVKERYGKLVTHIRKYNVTRPLFQGAACIVNSLGVLSVGYDHVPDVFSQNENLQDHTSEKYLGEHQFGQHRVVYIILVCKVHTNPPPPPPPPPTTTHTHTHTHSGH